MRQYIDRIVNRAVPMCAALLGGVLLLAGCAKDSVEDNGKPGDGETVATTFTLAPDFVEQIEVRSVTGANETDIKDLWVIQLNAAGTAQLQAPQYITTLTKGPSDYKVTVSIKNTASRVYFVANTHNAAAYTAANTSTKIEAVAMAVTKETDLATADGIPMSGMWEGTPDLLGVPGRVSLSRAIAKVDLSISASLPKGEKFTLQSITVKQVPNQLNYYRATTALAPYPVTPTVFNYDSKTYADIDLSTAPQSAWWYLPENSRGKGTATDQRDKAAKFPAGQKDYCTYIEIAGEYVTAKAITYNATYKIYIGANNFSDYNVNRNTIYTINTAIKGIDAADSRISLTIK